MQVPKNYKTIQCKLIINKGFSYKKLLDLKYAMHYLARRLWRLAIDFFGGDHLKNWFQNNQFFTSSPPKNHFAEASEAADLFLTTSL